MTQPAPPRDHLLDPVARTGARAGARTGARATTRPRVGARDGALRAALMLVLVAAAFGCDGAPQGISHAALFEVWVSSPHTADQAFHLAFNDLVEAFDPAPHIQYFQDPARGGTTLVLVADWPLAAGETMVGAARLQARDPTTLPTAHIVEVARSDYRLRDTLAGYGVRLAPR
jgi:hypothetical protein